MDWMREWILKISGVIVLAAIMDIIMTDGNMKKYIKPVMGFILVLTIASPISKNVFDDIKLEVIGESPMRTVIYDETMDMQNAEILRLYEKRVAESIQSKIEEKYQVKAQTAVTAEKENGKWGNIIRAEIQICLAEGQFINAEDVKGYIAKEYDIAKERISTLVSNTG